MQDLQNKNIKLGYWLLCAILIAIPCFAGLERLPIMLWDESRQAINAYEMSKSSNWWVSTFNGHPEMWNTKPGLLIWMQALLIKTIGLRPLALRLPVAIAVFVTGLSLFQFVTKQSRNYMMGLLAALVLITTEGYMTIHVARTGDFDGLLILFTSLACFQFFNYTKDNRSKNLYYFFLFLGLAVLTKSIAGLLFLPGLLIYLITQRKFKSMLSTKHFYFGILLFLLIVMPYYLIREHYNPGYLQAVRNNEFGGRFLLTKENNHFPFYYYIVEIARYHLNYWFGLLIIGAVIGVFQKNEDLKKLSVLSLSLSASLIFLLSLSKTKIIWYIAPIYPFTAFLIALALNAFASFANEKLNINARKLKLVLTFSYIAIFAFPYFEVIRINILEAKGPVESVHRYNLSRFLMNKIDEEPEDLNGLKIVSDNYIPYTLFYVYMANEKGIDLEREYSKQIAVGQKIAVLEPSIKKLIEKKYQYVVLQEVDELSLYKIMGEK